MTEGRIFQINRSDGGVPKLPVREAVIGDEGVEGDRQRNRRAHGGPDRALCLYPLEHILALQAEGHPIYPGSTGENLTLSGLDWDALGPGVRLRLGDQVKIEITSYTTPCGLISESFTEGRVALVSQESHPGWSRLYARVLTPGTIRAGDPVRAIPSPGGSEPAGASAAADPARPADSAWRTKPTDRFLLKWIKLHLSARITPRLVAQERLRPWMITLAAASLGVLGGMVFAIGHAFLGATVAAAGQVLDGVDGQFARWTGRASPGGAFLDSVLDRFADGAVVIGLTLYLAGRPDTGPLAPLLLIGALALIGSNLVSYSKARAATLGIGLGPPTLASKGTRATILILGGWGSLLGPGLPSLALFGVAFLANAVVIRWIFMANPGPRA